MKAENIVIYTAAEPKYLAQSNTGPTDFFLRVLQEYGEDFTGYPRIVTAFHPMSKGSDFGISLIYRRGLDSRDPNDDTLLNLSSSELVEWMRSFARDIGSRLMERGHIKGVINVKNPSREQLEEMLDFHLPRIKMPKWIGLNLSPERFNEYVVPILVRRDYEIRTERKIVQ